MRGSLFITAGGTNVPVVHRRFSLLTLYTWCWHHVMKVFKEKMCIGVGTLYPLEIPYFTQHLVLYLLLQLKKYLIKILELAGKRLI